MMYKIKKTYHYFTGTIGAPKDHYLSVHADAYTQLVDDGGDIRAKLKSISDETKVAILNRAGEMVFQTREDAQNWLEVFYANLRGTYNLQHGEYSAPDYTISFHHSWK